MSLVPTLPLRADVLLSNSIFMELDGGISAAFLRQYTANDNLEEIEFLELQVDTTSSSQRVECLGELLPNLLQLRMNQSSIRSIRDLGTGLSRLRVLWLCRSSLQDLGGIVALPVLEELYVSFNDVRELAPLLTHEALQVLDLEGNSVEDFNEVKALKAVSTLREINLSLNPFLKTENVARAHLLDELPQIEVLDDIPRNAAEADWELGSFTASEPLPSGLSASGLMQHVQRRAHGGLEPGADILPGNGNDGVFDQEPETHALQELLRRAGRSPKVASKPPAFVAPQSKEDIDTLTEGALDKSWAVPRPPSTTLSTESKPPPPPDDGNGLRRASSWACLASSGESRVSRPGSSQSTTSTGGELRPLRRSSSGPRLEKPLLLCGGSDLGEKVLRPAPLPLEKGLGGILGPPLFETAFPGAGSSVTTKNGRESRRASAKGNETPFGAGASGPQIRSEGKRKPAAGVSNATSELHSWATSLTSAAPAAVGLAGGKAKTEKLRPPEASKFSGHAASEGSAPGAADSEQRRPMVCEDSTPTLSTSSCVDAEAQRPPTALAQAVAEWRAGRCPEAAMEADRNFEEEPNEQDLVVEALKSAPRPVPSHVAFATARMADEGGHKFGFGFLPDRRELRTAWSSSASSSTVYRPTSASTCTSSGASGGWPMVHTDSDMASSDLTLGDEALVGNPLAAVRRRRRNNAKAAGPDGPPLASSTEKEEDYRRKSAEELSIRNLLRTHYATIQESCPVPTNPTATRLMTPDVRIRTLTHPALGDGALPQRTGTSSKERPVSATANFSADGRPCEALLAPSFATATGEVLLVE